MANRRQFLGTRGPGSGCSPWRTCSGRDGFFAGGDVGRAVGPQAAPFPGEGSIRHLAVHGGRPGRDGHLRPQARADPTPRPAARQVDRRLLRQPRPADEVAVRLPAARRERGLGLRPAASPRAARRRPGLHQVVLRRVAGSRTGDVSDEHGHDPGGVPERRVVGRVWAGHREPGLARLRGLAEQPAAARGRRQLGLGLPAVRLSGDELPLARVADPQPEPPAGVDPDRQRRMLELVRQAEPRARRVDTPARPTCWRGSRTTSWPTGCSPRRRRPSISRRSPSHIRRALRPRRATSRARTARSACWLADWSSAASDSSRFTATTSGTPTTTWPTITASAAGRPTADRGPPDRPQATRSARLDAWSSGAASSAGCRSPRKATAATITPTASWSGWPAEASREASSHGETDEIGWKAARDARLGPRPARHDPPRAGPRPQAADLPPQRPSLPPDRHGGRGDLENPGLIAVPR